MQTNVHITKDIIYLGIADTQISLFENMYPLDRGVQYNSYLILDEQTCLLDTIDLAVTEEFFDKLYKALNGRVLNYLIIQHMEPDHCGNIANIINRFPNIKLIGNKRTFGLLEQFVSKDHKDKYIEVQDGDTLSLGTHTLKFNFTPMLHWPEVMMTFDEKDKVLFSADAFGSFGAIMGNLFSCDVDFKYEKLDEFRRYYINIVGKFGTQVSNALKKLSTLDIKMILPLHGHVIVKDDIQFAIEKYSTWANYQSETNGIVLCYASMHGNTAKANFMLAELLAKRGVKNIEIFDVSRTHHSNIIAKLHQYSHATFSALSYNGGLHKNMAHLLDDLLLSNYQNKTIGILFNTSWASAALKITTDKFATAKNVNILEPIVTIRSKVDDDSYKALEQLADALANSILKN